MADTGNLKVLADLRLKEAEELLRVRMWSGAYYLSGYALELALKAAATKSFRPHHMPDKAFVTRLHTDDLKKLLTESGLEKDFGAMVTSDAGFGANWGLATKWTEEARYRKWLKDEAQAIVTAVGNKKDGLLPWIKIRW